MRGEPSLAIRRGAYWPGVEEKVFQCIRTISDSRCLNNPATLVRIKVTVRLILGSVAFTS